MDASSLDALLLRADSDGDDETLLHDMLAMMEDADDPASPRLASISSSLSSKKTKSGGIGSAARRKLALDALRIEESRLREQIDQLRSSQSGPFCLVRERAMTEQLRRHHAERECQVLRAAVLYQMRLLRGFHGLWGAAPGVSLGFDLSHYLHNFTRLPRDRVARQSEYMVLSRAERLDAAIQLLCHETEAISVVDAFLDTDYRRESDEICSATTKSVFTMAHGDVPAVLRAAWVATREIMQHSRPFCNVSIHGEIVDADADALSHNNIQYRATSVRKQTDECEDFSIESLELTMYKMVGDTAVMLWDYVDEDELQSLCRFREIPDISRQSLGACLIREELCPDGVKRVVYRELSMRKYVYRGSEPTPPARVQRYFASKPSSVGPNELVFRDIMATHIAAEEHATLHTAAVPF